MMRVKRWAVLILVSLVAAGCGGSDASPQVPESDRGKWLKFEPPGAVCGDGSQYKYFVQYPAKPSDNVVIYFEPGGACWDYESCSVKGGIRGAAHPHGIPDNLSEAWQTFGLPPEVSVDQVRTILENAGLTDAIHIIKDDNGNYELAMPFDTALPTLSNIDQVNPMASWNKVFIPYCTGDLHTGNRDITYVDPEDPSNTLLWHHQGHKDVMLVLDELKRKFPHVDRMMVTGCSAGGGGTLANYYFVRKALRPNRGYMLDDAGPVFPELSPTARSRPLHLKVRDSWDLDSVLRQVPGAEPVIEDFGNLSSLLAQKFPHDHLGISFFRLDYNYSVFSYERFYVTDAASNMLNVRDPNDRALIYRYWWDDIHLMRLQYDQFDNLSYFIPFWRKTNDSHCITIPGFEDAGGSLSDITGAAKLIDLLQNDPKKLYYAGSDMQTPNGTMDEYDYINTLLDDSKMPSSYFEDTPEGPFIKCTPGNYDALGCAQAVCDETGSSVACDRVAELQNGEDDR